MFEQKNDRSERLRVQLALVRTIKENKKAAVTHKLGKKTTTNFIIARTLLCLLKIRQRDERTMCSHMLRRSSYVEPTASA